MCPTSHRPVLPYHTGWLSHELSNYRMAMVVVPQSFCYGSSWHFGTCTSYLTLAHPKVIQLEGSVTHPGSSNAQQDQESECVPVTLYWVPNVHYWPVNMWDQLYISKHLGRKREHSTGNWLQSASLKVHWFRLFHIQTHLWYQRQKAFYNHIIIAQIQHLFSTNGLPVRHSAWR